MKKELSIFIDESGDFGQYQKHCPFYLVTFVLHNQKDKIDDQLKKFKKIIDYLDLPNNYIHAGPILRKEGEYEKIPIPSRRKVFISSIDFIRKLPIKYHTFLVERKKAKDSITETISLSRQINDFLLENNDYFEQYEDIKVYYDNGQNQLSLILGAALSGRMGSKLIPVKVDDTKKYILFQMADICCTIELVKAKLDNGLFLNSEKAIFNTEQQFLKNYYHKLDCKRI